MPVVQIIERDALAPIVLPAFVTPEAFAAEVNKREQNDADLLAATQAADAKATQAKSAAETAQSTATNAQTSATSALTAVATNTFNDEAVTAAVALVHNALNAEDAAFKNRLNSLEAKDAELTTAIQERVKYEEYNPNNDVVNANFAKLMGAPTPK